MMRPAYMLKTRIAGALFLAFAVTCLLVTACAQAWADDDNLVDTGQLPDSSFVYQVSIYDLQSSDTYYEGQTVQITGEVVGDIIYDEVDEGHRWITVNSLPGEQEATIQVYVTADQAELIDTLGRYQVKGSTVSVLGRFHLVCGQHDGLTDLHASSLTVTEAGSKQQVEFPYRDFVPAAALVVLGLALFLVYNRKREELQ